MSKMGYKSIYVMGVVVYLDVGTGLALSWFPIARIYLMGVHLSDGGCYITPNRCLFSYW